MTQIIVTILCSVLASSGLWAFITNKVSRSNAEKELLLGLAHDRIMFLGTSYIDRDPAYITQDEYENLKVYLYEPYSKMGGNGSAKRIMEEVEKLPIHSENFSKGDEKHAA
jgi:hypothetical protein|nr:MAG TPA: holin protein [Caudoviricetes sp.]